MNQHLTEPNPHLARMISNTPDGMAHWAGSGPAGKTCGGCVHYGYEYTVHGSAGDYTKQKPAGCGLFYRLMKRHAQRIIPKATPACSHFAPAPTEPTP